MAYINRQWDDADKGNHMITVIYAVLSAPHAQTDSTVDFFDPLVPTFPFDTNHAPKITRDYFSLRHLINCATAKSIKTS